MEKRRLNDERDEFLAMKAIQSRGRAGASATEIALAVTAFQRRPSIKHLAWLGRKVADRMVRSGKVAEVNQRYVAAR